MPLEHNYESAAVTIKCLSKNSKCMYDEKSDLYSIEIFILIFFVSRFSILILFYCVTYMLFYVFTNTKFSFKNTSQWKRRRNNNSNNLVWSNLICFHLQSQSTTMHCSIYDFHRQKLSCGHFRSLIERWQK